MISSNIRVPEDLWEELKKIADKEERSVNAQIIYLIKKLKKTKKNNNKICQGNKSIIKEGN